MKKFLLFCAVLSLLSSHLNAQFIDDMEYPNGIPPSSTWWDCEPPNGACPIIVGPGAGHLSDYAGWIPDDTTTEGLLNLGNKIIGEWGLKFWMYIPSGREAYFNLQGVLPVTTGEWIVGNFFFNRDNLTPGWGLIDDTALGDLEFTFLHDEWFDVIINVDLSAGIEFGTWEFVIDEVVIVPAGTPFTNENGDIPTSLGGIDFFSVSSNTDFYLDDFDYCDCFHAHGGPLSVADVDEINFSVYPNPVDDFLNIDSRDEIRSIKIYSMEGSLVLEKTDAKNIDVSQITSGLYFVEVSTPNGKSTQKFIKE